MIREVGVILTWLILIGFCPYVVNADSSNNSRKEAWKIYNRLNGHPPNDAQLEKMSSLIDQGNSFEAALISFDSGFYNGTLLDFASKWVSRSQSSRSILNDFSATVIGMVRDEVPFNQILSSDIVYTIDDSRLPQKTNRENNHYQQADLLGIDLKNKLVRNKQSEITNLPAHATAGVLTTQTAGDQFLTAGTNRAIVRFSFMSFLCNDMEDMHDTTRSDHRVRQDVSRTPGGESSVYINKCKGCHAGMDALAGSAAFYDYLPGNQGGLSYSGSYVEQKYHRDRQNFPNGFKTLNDSWSNIWAAGPNARMEWEGQQEGKGLKEMGAMLTRSKGFSRCMAKQALEHLCSVSDQSVVEKLSQKFSLGKNYNMKELFASASVVCK